VNSLIEERASQLDEMRRIRVITNKDVDFEKWVKASDAGKDVKDVSVYLDEMREELKAPVREVTYTMPWQNTQSTFRYRMGEVTVYAGTNGGGKSLITGQIALDLIRQGCKVCIASFEMKPKRTLYRMLRQFCGENIEHAQLMGRDLTKTMDRLQRFAGGQMFLYDQQGTVNARQVIGVARYCAVELGVNHFFVDSLMKCVAGEDDYNGQKNFIDELTSLARDHNIHIHLVHHIRKQQTDETMPNKNDLKGSGAIADQVDNVFLMWRNKKKEHEMQLTGSADPAKPDAVLMCEKQRNGEGENWFNMWYHAESQQFLESNNSKTFDFDGGGEF
jgi:twinkle protein|tara:strand:+ start:17720 stop:18715 length:996 start_codon:yes stop_codon:yes gene_type:complete